MKYVSIMPLIGGMTIAAENIFNKKPEFLLSYEVAKHNDYQYLFNNSELNDKYFLLNEDNKFIKKDDEEKFIDLNNNIDIVTAVPFCSGLSMLNSSISNNQVKNEEMSRGSEAIQNRFIYLTIEFALLHIKPKVFIFENAPTFFTELGKGVFDNVIKIVKKYGYSFTNIKTSTLLHGLPQNRTRSFGIAWKSDKVPIINWYNKQFTPVNELFKEIPKDATYNDYKIEEDRFNNDFIIKYMINRNGKDFRKLFFKESSPILCSYIVPNNKLDDIINFAKENNEPSIEKKLRFIKSKIDNNKGFWDWSPVIIKEYTNAVISKNSFRTIHPVENRFFTLRENMTLMGLPYNFQLSNVKFSNMITQNVPVNTAQDMIKECVKFINGELPLSNNKIIKQNNINQTIEYVDKQEKNSFKNLIGK